MVTEIAAAIAFLDSFSKEIQERYQLYKDVETFVGLQQFVDNLRNYQRFVETIKAFNELQVALISGLNSKKLVWEKSPYLSQKRSISYPKIFGGLMATVFLSDGRLREEPDLFAIEILLHILAFFKRVQLKPIKRYSREEALRKFHESQENCTINFADEHISSLAQVLEYYCQDIDDHLIIGYPGEGSTTDRRDGYIPRLVRVVPPSRYTKRTINMKFDGFKKTKSFEVTDIGRRYSHPISTILEYYNQALRNSSSEMYPTGIPFDSSGVLTQDYELPEFPILELTTVPKGIVDRPITTVPTAVAAVGATIRKTLVSSWKRRGIDHQITLDDQTVSHKILLQNWRSSFCGDWANGTQSISNELRFKVYHRIPLLRAYVEYQRRWTYKSETDGVTGVITTQMMGDSASVAELSQMNHAFSVVSAGMYLVDSDDSLQWPDGSRLITGIEAFDMGVLWEIIPLETALEFVKGLSQNIIGDDYIGPGILEEYYGCTCRAYGVTLNDKKSSSPGSLFKETCGVWILNGQRIYPYRLPVGSNRSEQLVSSTAFLQDCRESRVILELTLCLSSIYGKELECESHSYDQIGSPVGFGLPYTIKTKPTGDRIHISDDLAYWLGCSNDIRKSVEEEFFFVTPTGSHTVQPHSRKRLATGTWVQRFKDISLSNKLKFNKLKDRYPASLELLTISTAAYANLGPFQRLYDYDLVLNTFYKAQRLGL